MARPGGSLFNQLTWISAAIGVLAAGLLYFAATYTVRQHADATLAKTVDTDLAGLVDIYATGGPKELRQRIADRLTFATTDGDRAHYLVTDGTGNRIAGDLANTSQVSTRQSEARFVTLKSGQDVLMRGTQLGPDLQLFVAREYGDRSVLLRELGLAFLLAGCGVVVMIVAAGRWAALGLRRRVASVNAKFLADEDTGASDNRDELDMLSSNVATVLSHQKALVASHRNISDQTAHELRTPLMHLDMRLQKALERSHDAGLTEALVAARADIKQIIRMLESLLDIAASEAQRGDTSRLVETNLSELAISLTDLFAESAEDCGLALETAIAPDVMMRCDAMQMTRLLSNLLDNALKYVPSGGTVRVSVSQGPRISVIDNGPGIAPAMRDLIFDRFKRSDAAAEEGHGLGLALVRAIAARHGMTVRCDDAKPGAAFIVEREQQ
jgi:signal transduction histidine kinase